MQNGVVVQSGESNTAYGISVTIEHTIDDTNIVYSLYAHLSEVNVNVNDVVSEGQIIAKSGITGNAGLQTLRISTFILSFVLNQGI